MTKNYNTTKPFIAFIFLVFLTMPGVSAAVSDLSVISVDYNTAVGDTPNKAITDGVIGKENITITLYVKNTGTDNFTFNNSNAVLTTGDSNDEITVLNGSTVTITPNSTWIPQFTWNISTSAGTRSLTLKINGTTVTFSSNSFIVYSHADDLMRAIADLDIYIYNSHSILSVTDFDLTGTSYEYKTFSEPGFYEGGVNISKILAAFDFNFTITKGVAKPTINSITIGSAAESSIDTLLDNRNATYNVSDINGNSTAANQLIDEIWTSNNTYDNNRTIVKNSTDWTITYSDIGASDLSSGNLDTLQSILNNGTKILNDIVTAFANLGDLSDDVSGNLTINSTVDLGSTTKIQNGNYVFTVQYQDQFNNSGSTTVDVHISGTSLSIEKEVCGDGYCASTESCSSCKKDCGSCGSSGGTVTTSSAITNTTETTEQIIETKTENPYISYDISQIGIGTTVLDISSLGIKGIETEYTTNASEASKKVAFTEIALDTNAEMSNVKLSIEAIAKENLVNNIPAGIAAAVSMPAESGKKVKNIYQYVHIEEKNVNANAIDKARIEFKVKKSWIKEQDGKAEDIVLARYNNNKWVNLETDFKKSDNNYYYYESKSPGLSYFAVFITESDVPVEEQEITSPNSRVLEKSKPIPLKFWWAELIIITFIVGFIYFKKVAKK